MSEIYSNSFTSKVNRPATSTTIYSNTFSTTINKVVVEQTSKNTQINIYNGTTPLVAVNTTPTKGQYKVTITDTTNCTAKLESDYKTITLLTITGNAGEIHATINIEGKTTVNKTIPVAAITKSSVIKAQEAKFEQDLSGFRTTVSETYATKTDVSSSVSKVEQTANKINWLIESGTSSSNMTLTDESLNIITKQVKVTGDMIVDGAIDGKTITGATIIGSTFRNASNTFSVDSKGNIDGANITGSSIDINDNFIVSKSGNCTAKNITITGGKIDVGPTNFIIRSAHLYMQDGDVSISNNCGFRAKDYYDNTCTMMVLNEDNTMRFGWGSWDSHSTVVYDAGVEYMGGARTVIRGRDKTYLVCNGGTYDATGGSSIVFMNNGSDYVFRPQASGKTTCGTKAYPWKNIYGNSITNLSDRTVKENIKYVSDTTLYNSDVEIENDITTQDMYNFIREDCALATYNYTNDEHKTPKLNFIANDVIVNSDGSDNKVGQLIVNPTIDAEGGILGYDLGNYISVIAGALQQAMKKIEELEEKINKQTE